MIAEGDIRAPVAHLPEMVTVRDKAPVLGL